MATDLFSDIIGSPWFSWFLLSLIFWALIIGLVYLLRNKKEAIYLFFPLLALMRTKKLNKFITKVGKRKPKFWRIFWTIGIFCSFAIMIYGFWFFFSNIISLIFEPKIENIITPLIPGLTIPWTSFLTYFILPILFIMTTHEFAHGISSSNDDVEIKSTGVMAAGLFFIIGFGAFVEVDERELSSRKYHHNTRLRIAAAGTYVNGLTVFLVLPLLILYPLLISPFYGNQVTQVDSVSTTAEGGFNYEVLEPGDVIEALKKNGTSDYIYLDAVNGISYTALTHNQTDKIKCTAGEYLNLKIYIPSSDSYTEKTVLLGPRYLYAILFEYISNSELKITRIYTKEEGGNNYDKNLEVNMIIMKVNGTPIDVAAGNTFEKYLTTFNLTHVELTDSSSKSYLLDLEIIGVITGFQSTAYYMPLNDVAKFFTGNFPVFIQIELELLFAISFSIALFNSMPLPVFDGDRMIKELISWKIGAKYKGKKKKTDKFLYEKGEAHYELSEYRVEEIESVEVSLYEKSAFKIEERGNVIVGKENYRLIDKIGDGFKSTLFLDLPETQKIPKKSVVKVEYNYVPDTNMAKKKKIQNLIRYITLAIVLGNFILSYVKFGSILFWV